MNIAGQLILLHVVTGAMVALCADSMRSRRFDDLTYDARMNSPLRRLLMPGKLADREVWRKQQRIISWFGLIFASLIYVFVMFKILHEHSS
jgi:hypothetical protein